MSSQTRTQTRPPARTQTRTSTSTRPLVRMAQLPHAQGLPLPAYQTAGAAGLDLVAAVPLGKPLRLAPRARTLVPTGLVMELPTGYEAQVRPRSGLAVKHGVTVLNTPGTIDCDYRGEVQVILVNLGSKAFRIERGERIAQLVIAPAPQVRIRAVPSAKLSPTTRGTGGFGSTGSVVDKKRTASPANKQKIPPSRGKTKRLSPARPAR